jgi:hypothetical protein
MSLRKFTTTLAVVLAAGAVLGVAANPASADVANPIRKPFSTSYSYGEFCQNFQSYGVKYQYGAWAYYVDGCTTSRLSCPAARGCLAKMHTSIGLLRSRGDLVTQNARIRRFTYQGALLGWTDKSCSGTNSCSNDDTEFLNPGQSATVQCNGVYEGKYGVDEAVNGCRLEIVYL